MSDTNTHERVKLRTLKSAHIVAEYYFKDGRILMVQLRNASRAIYCMRISNPKTGYVWVDSIGYTDLRECMDEAENIFGFLVWDALYEERLP